MARAEFAPDYFLSLQRGEKPKDEHLKLSLWPSTPELGNMLVQENRKIIMGAINVRAREVSTGSSGKRATVVFIPVVGPHSE